MSPISPNTPFIVLNANQPWLMALADALAATAPVTAMRFSDLLNWLNHKPYKGEPTGAARRSFHVLPPGYVGRLEALFRPILTMLVDRERRRLRRITGQEPYVVVPYPYLTPWVRNVPPERLIYYNLDEYAFYDLSRADRIRAQESALIAQAHCTVCLAQSQVEALGARNPDYRVRIHHFPLGVVEAYLNPDPLAPPEPRTVGYIGNLVDRVDWALVGAVARRCPDVRFDFFGDLRNAATEDRGSPPDWATSRADALALPNVRYAGSIPQHEVAPNYWRYAVNWMPYSLDNGFNLASCPTKIMDAFGAGRPFVSTRVPECLLYPDRIHLVNDAHDCAQVIKAVLSGATPHNGRAMVNFARRQTWLHRAAELRAILGDSRLSGALLQSGRTRSEGL